MAEYLLAFWLGCFFSTLIFYLVLYDPRRNL